MFAKILNLLVFFSLSWREFWVPSAVTFFFGLKGHIWVYIIVLNFTCFSRWRFNFSWKILTFLWGETSEFGVQKDSVGCRFSPTFPWENSKIKAPSHHHSEQWVLPSDILDININTHLAGRSAPLASGWQTPKCPPGLSWTEQTLRVSEYVRQTVPSRDISAQEIRGFLGDSLPGRS